MSFNPNEHMMKLKGKDYLQVAWRLVWFRDEHPDWCINAELLTADDEHAVFKAAIYDAEGKQKSSGHGSESKRDFGDFLEKAETKAVGRALAMLGYGTQFAGGELDEGERIVDSPIDRKPKDEVTKETVIEPKFDARKAISLWCMQNHITLATFGNIRKQLIESGDIPDIKSGDMTEQDYEAIITAIVDRGLV